MYRHATISIRITDLLEYLKINEYYVIDNIINKIIYNVLAYQFGCVLKTRYLELDAQECYVLDRLADLVYHSILYHPDIPMKFEEIIDQESTIILDDILCIKLTAKGKK